MTKSQIYAIRARVHAAMTNANNSKTAYSPLLRMEWKKYGYIPVSARNNDQYTSRRAPSTTDES